VRRGAQVEGHVGDELSDASRDWQGQDWPVPGRHREGVDLGGRHGKTRENRRPERGLLPVQRRESPR
jgi:hypothetical protein